MHILELDRVKPISHHDVEHSSDHFNHLFVILHVYICHTSHLEPKNTY